MYGHEGVSRDFKRRIETRLPARLALMREDKGASLAELPNPAKVVPYFLPYVDIGHYPTICVTELDTPTGLSGAREVRQGTRFDSYVYRYPFRVWVYVRSVDYGVTELMLKRYLTAMREVVLENRVLTDNDDAHVIFDPESTEMINISTRDPRADLPLDVQGGVRVRDLHTDAPTGEPAAIPERP